VLYELVVARLNADPQYGTNITRTDGTAMPVMWRPGYTARNIGSEVEVLDPNGRSVAVTGRTYNIEGGTYGSTYIACGFVNPV
jgi:hypothetical protein